MFKEIPARKKIIAGRYRVHIHGINDAWYVTQPSVNGKQLICPFYKTWSSILQRVYCKKTQERQPTYKGASICEHWHSFMAFREWMRVQDWEEKTIDKDIIVPGNKHYSPETCCFVTHEVNSLLCSCKKSRGAYPQGVSLHKESGKYRANMSVHGRLGHIGTYKTVTEASEAYQKEKSAHIIRMSMGQSDKRVREGMRRHARLIWPQVSVAPYG